MLQIKSINKVAPTKNNANNLSGNHEGGCWNPPKIFEGTISNRIVIELLGWNSEASNTIAYVKRYISISIRGESDNVDYDDDLRWV